VPEDVIARSHGFLAVASDGPCGAVETPLFPPDGGEPDFLVVRIGDRVRPRFPIVPAVFVAEVDPEREVVRLALSRAELRRLPERLPLAGYAG
jgi:hypothetical protein